MINENEKRICKGKGCKKELPVGYKYEKCESCRNKFLESGINIVKTCGAAVVGVVGLFFIIKKYLV